MLRSILCFKAIDCTVLLGDRVLAGFDFIKYYLEQEAVLGVACYAVAFTFESSRQRSVLSHRPSWSCRQLRILQVFTCRFVLDCEGQRTFRLFLRHTARHGLREGQLAGRDCLIVILQVDLDLLRCL